MHEIKQACPGDIGFIIDLAKKFTNQLGFIPKIGIEEYIKMGRVKMIYENDCPAGYLLGRASMKYNRDIVPITQAAIAYDAQRQSAGKSIVAAWECDAIAEMKSCLQCWVAEDIEARYFWSSIGFTPVMIIDPGNTRGRKKILFRKSLIGERFDIWTPPPRAGWKAQKIVESKQGTLF